jgi:hypothetical protein
MENFNKNNRLLQLEDVFIYIFLNYISLEDLIKIKTLNKYFYILCSFVYMLYTQKLIKYYSLSLKEFNLNKITTSTFNCDNVDVLKKSFNYMINNNLYNNSFLIKHSTQLKLIDTKQKFDIYILSNKEYNNMFYINIICFLIEIESIKLISFMEDQISSFD